MRWNKIGISKIFFLTCRRLVNIKKIRLDTKIDSRLDMIAYLPDEEQGSPKRLTGSILADNIIFSRHIYFEYEITT